MRPGTPHFVVTLEASICNGGHFYCSATMQDTSFALFHDLVLHNVVTNTFHPDHRLLLAHMSLYWANTIMEESDDYLSSLPRPHLPDIQSYSGLVDLLSLMNIIIFGSILWQERYTDDPLSSEHEEVYKAAHQRVMTLAKWLMEHYWFRFGNEEVPFHKMWREFFVMQAAALYGYARSVEATKDSEGESVVTAKKVKQFFEQEWGDKKLVMKLWVHYTQNNCLPHHFAFSIYPDVGYRIGKKQG